MGAVQSTAATKSVHALRTWRSDGLDMLRMFEIHRQDLTVKRRIDVSMSRFDGWVGRLIWGIDDGWWMGDARYQCVMVTYWWIEWSEWVTTLCQYGAHSKRKGKHHQNNISLWLWGYRVHRLHFITRRRQSNADMRRRRRKEVSLQSRKEVGWWDARYQPLPPS